MTKSESKYFNTAQLMDEALIELLGKKDYSFITVKEICDKAGVNRSTFYLHYESMDELLNETSEFILKRFVSHYNIDPKQFIGSIKDNELNNLILINDQYLKPYLEFFKENKKIYQASFNNANSLKVNDQLSSLYKYVLKPIFERFNIPEVDQKYWLNYHIQGIMAIIKEWIKNDCKEDVEHMSKVIQDCVRPHPVSNEK